MENKICLVCKKDLIKIDWDVCRTCFSFLTEKYPDSIDFKEAIVWHKENLKEIEEE